ncbi:MAG: ArgE/DapE family deacylase [archaeon GB-1867-005]|nr:ArgE/DapE family deacylase [Candidatus Culexmicrobium cathedralense]
MNKKEIIEKIVSKIDESKNEIIKFLQEIIRIPSITGQEKDIQEFIASQLKEWGINYDMWIINENELLKSPLAEKPKIPYKNRPMLTGIVKGTGGGKSLLFNGHVDVIPPGPKESWKYDPFEAVVEEDYLYGRGASDMKSGIAAYTMAVKLILDAGFKPKGDIYMHYVIDEEYTSNGTLAALLRGYKADGAINAEASDMEIQPAVSGSMWFTVEVKGKTASMSRIWKGVNAIEQAYKVYEAVKKLYEIRIKEKKHPLYPDPKGVLALFIGILNAGTYPSAIPDKAVLKGRMGLLPGETIESAFNELKDFILNYSKTDPWLRFNPPIIRQEGYAGEGAEISVQHPVVQSLINSYRAALNMDPIIKGHEGATDMRILMKMGVPTVCFGPGTITQMHAYNERVKVSDVIRATKVMATMIVEWCGCEYVK